MRSILLIDDKETEVEQLGSLLRDLLEGEEVEIRAWVPKGARQNAREEFEKRVDNDTILVVTDYDLTSQGQTGLFGASIVSWCQVLAIPVGDYSRQAGRLPRAPEFFELRVPSDPGEAAKFVTAVFQGFRNIRELLESRIELLELRSPAAVLASVLGRPELESDLALYEFRIGPGSSGLMDVIESPSKPSPERKRALLAYISGHLLLNVLQYPGPILSLQALKSYVASDGAEASDVLALFGPAGYTGPFERLGTYFWLSGVNEVLDELVSHLQMGHETVTHGELFRDALECRLERRLDRHSCPDRCEGKNGGFYCPFTRRTVCQLPDCSVGSNGWLPRGASVCRIEREFFDEWSPILGF